MKKKIVGILVCTLLFSTAVLPVSGIIKIRESRLQPPIEWDKTYAYTGGPSEGHFVQQTSDGGYVVVGTVWATGGTDPEVYLVKTDVCGNDIWRKTFGCGSTGIPDGGNCVQQTTDGGYIIAGLFQMSCLLMLKTDSNGNEQWKNTYCGVFDYASSVKQTSDGGYILVGGYTALPGGQSDVWLIKTDANGVKQWDQKIGIGVNDYGCSVQQTTDGGYIIAGLRGVPLSEDVLLVKTDSSGTPVWIKTYGGANMDIGYSVEQTTDGGYIIAGETYSYGSGQNDFYLIKTDSSGNSLWTNTFGGTDYDDARSVHQTSDGGYIITGSTKSFGAGDYDIYLVKTDSGGNKQWDNTYGGANPDFGYCVEQTTDGGYIITGSKYGDMWLIKLGYNQPPNKPAKPSGPPNGVPGTSYTYSSTTTDPNGDLVFYWFDWGDGENSGWVGPFPSGNAGSASHTWKSQGSYSVKVKAKDPFCAESIWSDPLTVTIPRNKISISTSFIRLLEQFPNAFPLLRYVLGLL